MTENLEDAKLLELATKNGVLRIGSGSSPESMKKSTAVDLLDKYGSLLDRYGLPKELEYLLK